MSLDRLIAPQANAIQQLDLLEMESLTLNNGVPVKVLNHGTAELIEFEIIFKAGSRFQTEPLVSNFANLLFLEGNSKFTSKEINDGLDFYGSFFNVEVVKDFSSLKVYTLKKYLKEVLKIITPSLNSATFPENEFQILLNNKRSKFKVQSEKVDFKCRQIFTESLFKNGSYGQIAHLTDYDHLTLEKVKQFYLDYYTKGYQILMAGHIDNTVIDCFNEAFDGLPYELEPNAVVYSEGQMVKGNIFEEKEGAIQSALRVGRSMFNMDHEDFTKMKFVSTLLGGYFGSRLMMNIREDKGYTYGIGSGMIAYENSGVFLIASEVGGDVCADALKEVYFEIDRLKTEKVSDDEIALVKNFMLGSLLRSLDGPFDLMEAYKQVMLSDKKYKYYQDLVETINNMTAEDVMEMSQKYLNKEDLLEVVAGKL